MLLLGASSIVTKNIPDGVVAAGCPARVIYSIEEYYNKNKDKFFCTARLPSDEKKQKLLEQLK